ncbi:hypothetical protein AOLI_G00270580 [Acnodon oligacanthus]
MQVRLLTLPTPLPSLRAVRCLSSCRHSILEKVRTALREEFQSTEDSPETSRDLTENLQDQIEAEAEAEAIKLLDEEEADNNQPLGDEMLEMMAIKGEAQVIKDVVLTDLQDLRTENLRDINFADTEAEAIKPQIEIDGDDPGTPNDQPLDAETDWMIDYEPIKSEVRDIKFRLEKAHQQQANCAMKCQEEQQHSSELNRSLPTMINLGGCSTGLPLSSLSATGGLGACPSGSRPIPESL